MKAKETFETDRLLLRRTVIEDTQAVHAYGSDPEVNFHLPRRASSDISETKDHRMVPQSLGVRGGVPMGDRGERAGEVVGMIEARPSKNGVELGYVLNRAAWGNGYMTEAVTTVADWALAEPDVFRVWAVATVDNTRGTSHHLGAAPCPVGHAGRW